MKEDLTGKWVFTDSIMLDQVSGMNPHLVMKDSGSCVYISRAERDWIDGEWKSDGRTEREQKRKMKRLLVAVFDDFESANKASNQFRLQFDEFSAKVKAAKAEMKESYKLSVSELGGFMRK